MKKLVMSAVCACGVVLLLAGSAATASPISRHSISNPTQSPLVVLAGFGCKVINDQLVCGKSGGKTKSSDDSGDNADEHKKHQDDHDADNELTQCTIQDSSGGGGCKTGFKHVCQKLKNGKKCCGCVPDKHAQAPAEEKPTGEKIEDNPCFEYCSNQCGGPTKEARDACVLDCIQTTNCAKH